MTDYLLSRPAEVLRAKGFLDLFGYPQRILFQAVRDLFTADAWEAGDGTSELVVIGRGLDRAEFEAAWAACLTPDPTTSSRTESERGPHRRGLPPSDVTCPAGRVSGSRRCSCRWGPGRRPGCTRRSRRGSPCVRSGCGPATPRLWRIWGSGWWRPGSPLRRPPCSRRRTWRTRRGRCGRPGGRRSALPGRGRGCTGRWRSRRAGRSGPCTRPARPGCCSGPGRDVRLRAARRRSWGRCGRPPGIRRGPGLCVRRPGRRTRG